MAQPRFARSVLAVQVDQPLIRLILEDGRHVIRYFADEADAVVGDATLGALGAIGRWSDLDWGVTASALDRIRHVSEPTPPAEL